MNKLQTNRTPLIYLLLNTWYNWGIKFNFASTEKGCASFAAYILSILLSANLVSIYWLIKFYADFMLFPKGNFGLVLMLMLLFLVVIAFHRLYVLKGKYLKLNQTISKQRLRLFGVSPDQLTLIYCLITLVFFVVMAYLHIQQYKVSHGIRNN